jgi:hypothetical protein
MRIAILGACIAALFAWTGGTGAAAAQTVESPCADSLYQALSAKPLDDMSEREYEYFRVRERACLEHQARAALVNQPRATRPDRRPELEASTRPNPHGGADIHLRNASDFPVIVNSVRVYNCVNIRPVSCAVHYPRIRLAPGQSRRVLTVRYGSLQERSSYRYEYHSTPADQ